MNVEIAIAQKEIAQFAQGSLLWFYEKFCGRIINGYLKNMFFVFCELLDQTKCRLHWRSVKLSAVSIYT